jgi:2',3'-cyclic-nucleotide 2'-phosphodiesterase (5'-nucleotidase family)
MKLHCKKIVALLLAMVMILTVLPTMAFAADGKNDIVVLYTNDVHCGVDAGTPEGTMGYANLAAYKKSLQATYGEDNVILVDAGDAIQGEAIGTLSKGSYLVDIMNKVGYDYATFGNHEFDYGMDVALSLLEKSNATYLSCNFMDLRTNKAVAKAYEVRDIGGVKIGFVGISTPETFSKSTPTYFQDETGKYIYGFCEGNNGADLYKAVQAAIDGAKADGAQYIVAIAHLGIDEQSQPWTSREVIANTTGLDVVLDGHSHSTIAGEKVAGKDGKEVLLTSTGTKLNNIGKLTIAADGKMMTELVKGVTDVDAETDTFIKDIQKQYEALLNEVIGHTDVDLTTKDEDGNRAIRNQETNLGDLCADAYRVVLGADIAFVNGGGVRADIPAGDITYAQVIAVHPFGNMACVVEATGQEIIDALEMASRSFPGENGGFLQVSGLKYTINPYVESTVKVDDKGMFVEVTGERRVGNVKVLQADGTYAPIDLKATYKLASHNYMLKSGGDGINMFMDNKVLQDEVMIDNQVLISYIQDVLKGNVGKEYSDIYGEGRIIVMPFPFTDVAPDAWYFDGVAVAYLVGLVAGTSDTTFSPNKNLTRAEAAALLYRLIGQPSIGQLEGDLLNVELSDVEADQYYAPAVEFFTACGVISGYPDGTFRPNGFVTRQDLASMIFRLNLVLGLPYDGATETLSAKDWNQVHNYAKPAMAWAVHNQIMSGMSTEELILNPTGNTQRCQAVYMLINFALYIAENAPEVPETVASIASVQ